MQPAPTDSARDGEGGGQSAVASDRAVMAGLIGAAGVAALASIARGGPLNPPAGPVTPTGKTLQEIEPRTAVSAANTPGDAFAMFIITQPGSYYLTGNVSVPSNKVGIRIAASDVTLDLNGFRITGGGSAGSSGITDSGALQNITIRNGAVESTGGIGIFLLSQPCRIVDVTVLGNVGAGILTSRRVRVERVVAVGNSTGGGGSAGGIIVAGESIVCDCVSNGNTGVGIGVGGNVVVTGCTANANTGHGISSDLTAVVSGCISEGNGGAGIVMQHASIADGCTADANANIGIAGTFGAIVRNSTAQFNSNGGIRVGEGGLVARCTSNTNVGYGIVLGSGSLVTGCQSSFNTLHAINASGGSGVGVFGCSVRYNDAGIVVNNLSYVRDNECVANNNSGANAAGITANGAANRVEGNLTGLGFRGVQVIGSKNLIIRNSCRDTVNYDIGASNGVGPLVNRLSPGSTGVGGNGPVGSTMGTTDYFANFSF